MHNLKIKKDKLLIFLLSFILILTSMPTFSYAELSDIISDISDVSIEEMAEAEKNGEAPESETENEKFCSSTDELAFDPIYLMNHLDKSYIDLDKFDLWSFYEPVTAVKGVATYNKHRQSDFKVTEDNYIAGMDYQIPLYDLSANSKYYVCVPNANMKNSNFPFYDLVVAYNNDAGELVSGTHYEDEILYIPKKAIDNPTYTAELSDESSVIAVQFNYIVGESLNFSKEIPVQILNGDNPKNKVVQCPNIFDSDRLIVETGVRCKKDVSLYLNGQMIPMFEGAYTYDWLSGEMQIFMCPGVISNINIVFGKGDKEISANTSVSDDASSNASSSDATANSIEGESNKKASDDSEPKIDENESITESFVEKFKHKTAEIFAAIIDVTSDKVFAVTPSNMKFFKNSSGTITKLKGITEENMFVGWRGYYTPQKQGSWEAFYWGTTPVYKYNPKGFENAKDYMYSGYTTLKESGSSLEDEQFDAKMKWTWAIASYAQGVDLGLAHRNVELTANKKVSHNVSETKTETHTIWEWFNDLRTNLELNNGAKLGYNGLGGRTNFAIKFPSNGKINGCEDSLISSGPNKGRDNTRIPWESENTPKVINGAEDYYYAASCNHLETAAGSEGGFSKVYVACVGCSFSDPDNSWVSLAFVMNRKNEYQDACGIYKFKVEPQIHTGLRIQKVLSGGDGQLNGFEFTLTDSSGNSTPPQATNYNGVVEFTNLPPGTYTITETIPAEKQDQYFDITGSRTVTVTGAEDELIEIEWWNQYSPPIIITGTAAFTSETGANVNYAKSGVNITDTVYYSQATPGNTYTVSGKLLDKNTGATLDTASASFTASSTSGSCNVHFSMDASSYLGKSVVCYESIYDGGTLSDSWADLGDDAETIHFPRIETIALANSTGKHIMKAWEDQVVTDKVKYYNVASGKQYTVKGTLLNRETGEVVATAEKSFYASMENGEVSLSFDVNARHRKNETLVVYEDLFYNNVLVADEKDTYSEEQAIHIPKIKTKLSADRTEDHFDIPGNRQFTDRVYYWNLIPGLTYHINGELKHQKTLSNDATSSIEFTPSSADGYIDVLFDIDIQNSPYTYVAYEDVGIACESTDASGNSISNIVSIGEHKWQYDEEQAVHIAKITTEAIGKETQDHLLLAENDQVIIDYVYYKNLIPGREYSVLGTLVDKDSGRTVFKQEQFFIPTQADGIYEMKFKRDYENLKGHTLVAYEYVSLHHDEAARHFDISDAKQTVHIPEITTENLDYKTSKHIALADGEMRLIDTVSYKNLIPGREYEIRGRLFDKDAILSTDQMISESEEISLYSQTKLKDDFNKDIFAIARFTPTESTGSIDINFCFSGLKFAGHELVAFEELYYGEHCIAKHKDTNDEEQTVSIPSIKTKLTEIGTPGEALMEDKITYNKFIKGQEYTIEGYLIDKGNGNILSQNTKSFVAKERSGEESMKFQNRNMQGKTVVCFEKIYFGKGKNSKLLVARHENLWDKEQTSKVTGVGIITIDDKNHFFDNIFDWVATGDPNNIAILCTIFFTALLILITTIIVTKKEDE